MHVHLYYIDYINKVDSKTTTWEYGKIFFHLLLSPSLGIDFRYLLKLRVYLHVRSEPPTPPTKDLGEGVGYVRGIYGFSHLRIQEIFFATPHKRILDTCMRVYIKIDILCKIKI